ncbi:MAG: hypothetical protein J6M53_06875 [Bacteroidaceae bacterium]|nr:hypothetical protein [Bacteroidaceae bacterium]
MSLYPKWLLALAGVNLLGLLLAVFYLFGGVQPFGTSGDAVVRFLLYLATQCLWVVPVACFFGALRAHDYQHPVLAVFISLTGISILAFATLFLFQGSN